MKFLIMLALLASCGKKEVEVYCKTKEDKFYECLEWHRVRYAHPAYANQICGQKYQLNKCYK